MTQPSRARRILKWTGVGLCLAIIASSVLSLSWPIYVRTGSAVDVHYIGLFIQSATLTLVWTPTAWSRATSQHWQFAFESNIPGAKMSEIFGMPRYKSWRPQGGILIGPRHADAISIPFWLLLLLTAIPTAWLWHRDRGWRRPGCCLRCGYDLTGNTSGICSECGERRPNLAKTGTHEAVEAKG